MTHPIIGSGFVRGLWHQLATKPPSFSHIFGGTSNLPTEPLFHCVYA